MAEEKIEINALEAPMMDAPEAASTPEKTVTVKLEAEQNLYVGM